MTTKELTDRLITLYTSDPFNMDEETKFEVCELAMCLYRQTGNPDFLEQAESTGYLTNYTYLLQEYLKAVIKGQEEYTYNIARIYFDGKLGYTDYKKAYEYFSRAAKIKRTGDGTFENAYKEISSSAKHYLATMYRDGLYVEKDDQKYRELLDELYQIFLDEKWYENDRPEAYIDVAEMLWKEGKTEKGFEMIAKACDDICTWIRDYNTDVERLAAVNEAKYKLVPIDLTGLEPWDITELVKKPGVIRFTCEGRKYEIHVIRDNDENVIFFEGKYYRDVKKLVTTANIGEEPFHGAMFRTENWEVIQ